MRGKSLFFFSATALCVVVFIFGVASANAYAVPSTSSATNNSSNYNFDNSFQNLVSPFQNFFKSFQWNTSTTFMVNPTNTLPPPINISSGLQNTFTQPFVDFDNWFYGLTGVRLSGIVVVILNIISWALGLILGVVNWLLGLFH